MNVTHFIVNQPYFIIIHEREMCCPSSHMFKINDFRLFGPSINAWGIISHRPHTYFSMKQSAIVKLFV